MIERVLVINALTWGIMLRSILLRSSSSLVISTAMVNPVMSRNTQRQTKQNDCGTQIIVAKQQLLNQKGNSKDGIRAHNVAEIQLPFWPVRLINSSCYNYPLAKTTTHNMKLNRFFIFSNIQGNLKYTVSPCLPNNSIIAGACTTLLAMSTAASIYFPPLFFRHHEKTVLLLTRMFNLTATTLLCSFG